MRNVVILITLFVVLTTVFMWFQRADIAVTETDTDSTQITALETLSDDKQTSLDSSVADITDPRLAQIAEAIRTKYGDRIHLPDWQIKVLNNLLNLLQTLYPDTWQDAIYTVLKLAFPELADQLMARLQDWLDYQQWIAAVFDVMTFANADERRQTLWSKRRSLFGDDADIIWANELRQQAFDNALAEINQFQGSFDDKSDQYVQLVRDTFGETAFGDNGHNTTQLMQTFVGLESVQTELRDASPEDQDALLMAFRQDMGLSEAAVGRWQQLDAERRDHRENGDLYQQQREQILASTPEEDQQDALWQLQVELFGEAEAKFIQNEEASGVYRFETEQVIGLN